MSFSTNFPLPPEPAAGQPLPASWGVQLIRWCRANALLQVPGMMVSRSANGTSLRPQPAGPTQGAVVTPPNPFDLSIDASGDAPEGSFVPGAGQNLAPDNWQGTVDVPAGQMSYAFLRLFTDGDAVQKCTLMIDTAAPTSPVPVKGSLPQQVDVLLHAIVYTPPTDGGDGAGTYTPVRFFYPTTDVMLTAVVAYTTSVANPQPGGPTTDNWYTWQIGGT